MANHIGLYVGLRRVDQRPLDLQRQIQERGSRQDSDYTATYGLKAIAAFQIQRSHALPILVLGAHELKESYEHLFVAQFNLPFI